MFRSVLRVAVDAGLLDALPKLPRLPKVGRKVPRSITKKSPWAQVTVTVNGKAWSEYGLNQAFQRAQARAGRSGYSFHSVRHFFITELFRNGVPASAVQRLAGHAELTTTQLYADMVASDLQAAIATFSVAGSVRAEGV